MIGKTVHQLVRRSAVKKLNGTGDSALHVHVVWIEPANDVATGEYWFALRAYELKLVDEIITTDEYLLSQKDKAQIYSIKYAEKKSKIFAKT